jgi:hypothetical protein
MYLNDRISCIARLVCRINNDNNNNNQASNTLVQVSLAWNRCKPRRETFGYFSLVLLLALAPAPAHARQCQRQLVCFMSVTKVSDSHCMALAHALAQAQACVSKTT